MLRPRKSTEAGHRRKFLVVIDDTPECSRAVLYADRGDTQRAVEQYQRAIQAFPQYTQAKSDCNRLQAGACS